MIAFGKMGKRTLALCAATALLLVSLYLVCSISFSSGLQLCESNLRLVAAACEVYRTKFGGSAHALPQKNGPEFLQTLLESVITEQNRSIVACPFAPGGGMYVGPAGEYGRAFGYLSSDLFLCCPNDHSDGKRCVLTRSYRVFTIQNGGQEYQEIIRTLSKWTK